MNTAVRDATQPFPSPLGSRSLPNEASPSQPCATQPLGTRSLANEASPSQPLEVGSSPNLPRANEPLPTRPSPSQPLAAKPSPDQPHASQPLANVLAALGDRVAPTTMARERTLSTTAELAELFAEGGLVRGRVLSCAGPAATSLALALLAPAVAAGAWVALVDVPTIGLDAASELGMPLERIVAIDTHRHADAREGGGASAGVADDVAAGQRWADVVAAAADGFDVMIVRVPDGLRASTVRKVATRLQQRGVVMIVLGAPGPFACDGVIDTTAQVWSGLGDGWGHLRRRTVEVTATGRRLPGRRARTIALPTCPGRRDLPDALPDEPPVEQPARRLVVAGDLSTAC